MEPLAGTDIEEAAADTIEFAARLGVNVELTFNNVSIHVRPYSTIRGIVDGYHEAIRTKSKYTFER